MKGKFTKIFLSTMIPLVSSAFVVSCGSKAHEAQPSWVDVGMVIPEDDTIHSDFFRPMWKNIHDASEKKEAVSSYTDIQHGSDTKDDQKKAVDEMVKKGARLIFQPGASNSWSILENAVAHPDTLFMGVAYTKEFAASKLFTDVEHVAENRTLLEQAKNIGFIHFQTQQQGFVMGYLSAMKFFKDNPTKDNVKISTVAAHDYQDLTALMDGFLEGCQRYAEDISTNTRTRLVSIVAPVIDNTETTPEAKNKFFTNVDLTDDDYESTNNAVIQRLKTNNVDIVYNADPNAMEQYHDNGFILVGDGEDWGAKYDDVVISSNKCWYKIFNDAIEASLSHSFNFRKLYHDEMHLASFQNEELIINKHHSFSDEEINIANTALIHWLETLKNNSKFAQGIVNGKETAAGTCKGSMWVADLA